MQLVMLAVLFVSPVPEVLGGCSYESDNMTAYRGCVNTGHNGEECANWMQTCYWGDSQFIAEDQAAEHGIGNHNYCRNPGNQRWGPWCYRKNHNRHKIYCSVPDRLCNSDCQESYAPVQSTCPNAEANKGTEIDETESCSGPNCTFCHENAVACGIIGFLLTAIVLATAVFIRISLKWRKEATTLERNLHGTTRSHTAGSHVYFTEGVNRAGSDRLSTLPIEDLLSRMGTQPRNPITNPASLPGSRMGTQPRNNVTCARSLPGSRMNTQPRIQATHVASLPALRMNTQPKSHDNQVILLPGSRTSTQPRSQPRSCASSVCDNTLHSRYVAVPTVQFQKINNLSNNRIAGSMEFECGFDDVFSDGVPEDELRSRDGTMLESRSPDGTMFESRSRDGTMFESRSRDGTMFDRYNDQDMEDWDTEHEEQI